LCITIITNFAAIGSATISEKIISLLRIIIRVIYRASLCTFSINYFRPFPLDKINPLFLTDKTKLEN